MSINYQYKFSRLPASLADAITCLHHAHAAHLGATSKIKTTRAIRVKSRATELRKINDAIYQAHVKTQGMLSMADRKSCASCSMRSMEAEEKRKLRNKKFEEESRSTLFD